MENPMPRLLLRTLVIVASVALTGPLSAQTSPTDPPIATSPSNDPNAPLAGANSFTENQAKERMEKAGFTQVSGLKKDDNGIWRGTATMGGKQTPVALDYRGNVVAK
jgi:putative membrane protein